MRNVVIVQHRLLHYRVNLFELLQRRCVELGIHLTLAHGKASGIDLSKNDEGELPWALLIVNRYFSIGQHRLLWQHLPRAIDQAELVIVMQENRILSNYPLLISRLWSKRKIAFWGHGKNFQSDAPTGMREKWKSLMLRRVDWWFAYTKITADVLARAGFEKSRITCLNNAIDSTGFATALAAVSESDMELEKQQLAIDSWPIGLFCGSLYSDKKLELMIAACDKIKEEMHGFSLVVVGDGPSMGWLREQARSRPWIKLLGVRKGREKALAYSIASIVLNPGAVGLHIVDSFCAGKPLVTTSDARHGPEIAYLQNGVNGLAVTDDADNYAKAVVDLLGDQSAYEAMAQACRNDGAKYTLDNMVDNFVAGIQACLNAPRKSSKW